MASTEGHDDPFRDPSLAPPHAQQVVDASHVPDTLAVGRNASLTLGTDSLVVLGAHARVSVGIQCF
jgi:sphingosine kinase